MKLSVVIIAKNEADTLPACLQSVQFADEVVLIDDESTDNSLAIAKESGAKIFKRRLDGFATQKNFGIAKAHNDWVLILDADERVTPELAKQLQALQPGPGLAAYDIPRDNYIGQTWIKHGALGHDTQRRLINRHLAHYGQREIHELIEAQGETGVLSGTIIHLTYADTHEYLAKVRKYSRIEAGEALKLHQIAPYHGFPREFLYRYVKLRGFLDGWLGLISAGYEAYYRRLYYQYVTSRRI